MDLRNDFSRDEQLAFIKGLHEMLLADEEGEEDDRRRSELRRGSAYRSLMKS